MAYPTVLITDRDLNAKVEKNVRSGINFKIVADKSWPAIGALRRTAPLLEGRIDPRTPWRSFWDHVRISDFMVGWGQAVNSKIYGVEVCEKCDQVEVVFFRRFDAGA